MILAPSYNNKIKAQYLRTFSDFQSNLFLIWVCYPSPFTKCPKLLVMSGIKTKEGCATGLAAVQAALPLGSYYLADPRVLEESVADGDAVRSLWKAL